MVENPADTPDRRHTPARRLLFWASLLLAMAAIAAGYRYAAPAADLCIATLAEISDAAPSVPVSLPLSRMPKAGAMAPRTLRYRFTFRHDAQTTQPDALSIGEALPFYRLTVNGANLTPEVDLATTGRRDIAPHLHVLPAEVLRAGENVAELELPFAYPMGEVRIDQLCAGSRLLLESDFDANWWRMVGIPVSIAFLFCVLIVLAIALWLLSARQAAYAWYIGCLLLMLARIVYVSTAARPGTPLAWMLSGDVALLLLPYALYRFMSAYWQFAMPWLARLMLAMTSAALLCMLSYLLPRADLQQQAEGLFLLIVVLSDLLVVGAMASRLHALHRIERGVVVWVGCAGFFCTCLEIANLFQPLAQRWMWPAPLGVALIALGFGYLLIRRMALGADFFAQATSALADDLDHALDATATVNALGWADVSASIGQRERRRMMRDIHDGFGSRLVAVLTQARAELPHSALYAQLQRALLDMRLMLDALDDASRSLVFALARLRHRIEPLLASAGIASRWQIGISDGVSIDDRRRLIEVFRCLEELIYNCLQHSGATHVSITVNGLGSWLEFRVEDDGCGATAAVIDVGGGIARSKLRAHAMHGSLRIDAVAGHGTACLLRVPQF